MNRTILHNKRNMMLSAALIGLTINAGCIGEAEDQEGPSGASEVGLAAPVQPRSCDVKTWIAIGAAAARSIPRVGAAAPFVKELINLTSLGKCGVTIEDVMKVSYKVADERIISFAKSEIAAIDELIQSDQAINLPKLEARFTAVYTKVVGLADLDYPSTPVLVSAATTALTLQMMKIQLSHYQRSPYVKETETLADVTVRGYLTKKQTQFNTYWNKSSVKIEKTFIINPPRVDYNNQGWIYLPDGTKEFFSKRYSSAQDRDNKFTADVAEANAVLAKKRKDAYDALFVNAPFAALMDSLSAIKAEAGRYYSLAYKRPSSQSSNASSSTPASLANDGDSATIAKTGATDANPWWRVDLGLTADGQPVPVGGVTITTDTSSKFAKMTIELLDSKDKVVKTITPGNQTSIAFISTFPIAYAKSVRVRLTNEKVLPLRDIYVYSAKTPR
jgi:hypothetical protein